MFVLIKLLKAIQQSHFKIATTQHYLIAYLSWLDYRMNPDICAGNLQDLSLHCILVIGLSCLLRVLTHQLVFWHFLCLSI